MNNYKELLRNAYNDYKTNNMTDCLKNLDAMAKILIEKGIKDKDEYFSETLAISYFKAVALNCFYNGKSDYRDLSICFAIKEFAEDAIAHFVLNFQDKNLDTIWNQIDTINDNQLKSIMHVFYNGECSLSVDNIMNKSPQNNNNDNLYDKKKQLIDEWLDFLNSQDAQIMWTSNNKYSSGLFNILETLQKETNDENIRKQYEIINTIGNYIHAKAFNKVLSLVKELKSLESIKEFEDKNNEINNNEENKNVGLKRFFQNLFR